MEYGYIRVSTREQNEQRQLIALQEFGIDEKRIYLDKQSGKDFQRPSYKRLMHFFVDIYNAQNKKRRYPCDQEYRPPGA